MRSFPHVLLLVVGVACMACMASVAPTWAGPWQVDLLPVAAGEDPGATPDPALELASAAYEVDVLGSAAVGTLRLEFVLHGEDAIRAAYRSRGPGGRIKATGLEIAVEGAEIDAAPPASPATLGTRGATRPRRPAGDSSAPFTIEPGQSVEIRVAFESILTVREGHLGLQLPAVSRGVAEQTQDGLRVPVHVQVRVHHGEPLAFAQSTSHEIYVTFEGSSSLIEPDAGEIREAFDLALALGQVDEPTLVGYVGPDEDGEREVMVVLTPPAEVFDESVRPKQVLFVLDTSGSMAKGKLDQARVALLACLDKLRPTDQFNIAEFDADFTMFRDGPVVAEEAQLAAGRSWMAALRPGGNTLLLPVLDATFRQPDVGGRHRMIVILTDGNISNVPETLALIRTSIGEGRLFVVGIGEDMRQDTILDLAEQGRGTAAFAMDSAALEGAVAELFDSVAQPLAWDLQLDLGNTRVQSVYPTRLPDLYGGRPVTLSARVKGPLPQELSIHAETMEGLRTFTTTLPPAEQWGDRLPTLRRAGRREGAPGGAKRRSAAPARSR